MSVETGTSNSVYDLVLLTQQALADCARYQHFAEDAAADGDEELRTWFLELAASDREIADRGKALLLDRLRPPG